MNPRFVLALILMIISCGSSSAQTTAFTYQGKLVDNGTPANANYDFEFRLFDTATVGSGNQLGPTITLSTVMVSVGIFTVQLDFGDCTSCFSGPDRFLDIRVRRSGGSSFLPLSPRQPLTSIPYAIKSMNATAADKLSASCANCITSGQIQSVSGSAVTGTIPITSVPAGSASYVQNRTSPQSSSNFNISGDGTAGGTLSGNIVNAATAFSIGGNPVLSVAFSSTFVGLGAGASNGNAEGNSFFGNNAGLSAASLANSFFGTSAGISITDGLNNSFFGAYTAPNSTHSFGNSFFGENVGIHDSMGIQNTLIGMRSDVSSGNLQNATAIGAMATVSQSNSLVLGAISGINFASSDTNVGIGTTAPASRLHISGSGIIRTRINSDTNAGLSLTLNDQPRWSLATVTGDQFQIFNDAIGVNAVWITSATNNVGIGTNTPGDKLDVNGIIRVASLGSAGGTALCRNASNQISSCSSSLRYKTHIAPFHRGLDLVSRLQPITFNWKANDEADVGLAAEAVASVEPLLVTHNDKGEVEGVKYDRVAVVLLNAIKEQQQLIERQQQQIDDLKKLVCSRRRHARACR